MSETVSAPALDDETSAALTLFNTYVDADRDRTRREKRIKKAERAKDDAAAAVKKLAERGSAEEKAAAESAYRDASEAWRKLRDGEEPDEAPAKAEAPSDDEPKSDEPKSDEPKSDEPKSDEPKSDEEE